MGLGLDKDFQPSQATEYIHAAVSSSQIRSVHNNWIAGYRDNHCTTSILPKGNLDQALAIDYANTVS